MNDGKIFAKKIHVSNKTQDFYPRNTYTAIWFKSKCRVFSDSLPYDFDSVKTNSKQPGKQ